MRSRFLAVRVARIAIGSLAVLAGFAAPASAATAITPTTDASQIATAVAADQSLVTGASFVTLPPGFLLGSTLSPAATSDVPLASFATDGPTYGILSTGDPRLADDVNADPDSGENARGEHFQGMNVTIGVRNGTPEESLELLRLFGMPFRS